MLSQSTQESTAFLSMILADKGLEKLAEAAKAQRADQVPTHPRWVQGRPHKGGLRPGFTPYPHQTKAVDKAWDQGGRQIFAHGTGVGKSYTSVMFAEDVLEKRGGPIIVITPDGLKTQFDEQGIEKFTNRDGFVIQTGKDVKLLQRMSADKKAPDYVVVGWSMLRRHSMALRSINPSLVIADEAHKMKDPKSQNFKSFMELRHGVPHCLLLTGSIVSNSPNDMLPLLHAVSDGKVAAKGKLASRVTDAIGTFEDLFGKPKEKRAVTRPEEVTNIAGDWVDFISTDDLEKSLPLTTTEYVPVEMSDFQWAEYKKSLDGLPPSLVDRIMYGIVPPKKEQSMVFTRITRARQAAQSTQGVHGLNQKMIDTSPKLRQITKDAEEHLSADPRNKTVIYSNFVRGGVESLHYSLKEKGIPHSVFIGAGREIGDGAINREARDQGIRDFQAGKTRVLLLSGAGAEGLDLKEANMFQAMEGHFNPEVVRQAQARVRRLKGQQQFSAADRRVVIKRYVSVEPNPGFVKKFWRKMHGEPVQHKTTDQWVYNVAEAKHLTNEGVRIALSGAHPLQPGEDPNPERDLFLRPHKYLSKEWDILRGEWEYKYAKPL